MTSFAEYDYLFKILIVGDSGVGKTSVLLRYTNNSFSTDLVSTIGMDFKVKTLNVMGKTVKLQIWDTAGQERYHGITVKYYRSAQGVFIVYDLTSEASLLSIPRWVRSIDEHASSTDGAVTKILLGNKSDRTEQRAVSEAKGQSTADEHNMPHYETSACTGQHIEEAFYAMALSAMRTYDQHHPHSTVTPPSNLTLSNAKRSSSHSSGCC